MIRLSGRALLMTLLCSPLSAAPASSGIPLTIFPAEARPFSDWMTEGGWRSKRNEPRGWAVGNGALHLVSDGNSVLIGTERGFPRDISATPILRLRLKVRTVPRGTDLTRKSGDDAALRVYIAFDKGGGFFTPPNTIAYAWTERENAGTLIKSAYFSNLFYLSLGKGPTPGDDWVVVERDLAADYRSAFPTEKDLPKIRGLLLKCDSNDTKTSAESWLSAVELWKEARP